MNKVIEKCSHCGANLEYELGANEVICEYCGFKKTLNNNFSNSTNNPQPNIISNSNMNDFVDPGQYISNNKKKRKKSIKKKLLSLFFVLVIVASGIVYYIDYQSKNKEPEIFEPLPSEIETKDDEKKEYNIEASLINLAPDVDLNEERARYKNNDIIGRLEIPDLINVLVTKGTDNSYYLKHSIKKEYDIRGTEFLDYRLTPTSKQLNIYGHNTRDSRIKVAFLKLEQFLKPEYFENNKYIIFQHDGGKNFYKILAIKEIHGTNNEHMGVNYTGNAFVEHIKKMTTGEGTVNSRNIPYDENSEILVLQTCSHHWDNAYYIITAIKL